MLSQTIESQLPMQEDCKAVVLSVSPSTDALDKRSTKLIAFYGSNFTHVNSF